MDFDLDRAVEVLSRTSPTLQNLLRDVSDDWTRPNEGADTFSAFDVVGHLIDGEETDWMVRARIILSKAPRPEFQPYDRFRHRKLNIGRPLSSLLDEFAILRAENLTLLRSWELGQAELDLPGIHPKFGRVTLRELLSAWVVHDLGHVAQVARVMAKQYKAAVGPWVEFLPVLTDHERPRS
jgi:hypothetical protein